jgi:Sigma-70, region 4
MDGMAARGETDLGEEVREACMRLPERQREALAMHGVERLSYEEIAVRMRTSSGSVAQLISRARINLYDELCGTALASVAPPLPECEQALPLIAAREDGQLEAVSGDPAWLDAHLAGCERCRLGLEQMHEAEAAYRAGAPIEPPGESPESVTPPAPSRFRLSRGRVIRLPRRRAALIGASAVLLLLAGLAAAFAGDDGTPSSAAPAADAASGRGTGEAEHGAKPSLTGGRKGGTAKTKAKAQRATTETNGSGPTAADATPTQVTVPPQATAGGDAQSTRPSRPNSGKAGVKPTQRTSAPQSPAKPKPTPTATPTSQPATGPTTPATEAQPPTEEPSDKPGRSGEAPGKPPGHPPH